MIGNPNIELFLNQQKRTIVLCLLCYYNLKLLENKYWFRVVLSNQGEFPTRGEWRLTTFSFQILFKKQTLIQNSYKEASYRNLYETNFCLKSNSRRGLFYNFFWYEASFKNYWQLSCRLRTKILHCWWIFGLTLLIDDRECERGTMNASWADTKIWKWVYEWTSSLFFTKNVSMIQFTKFHEFVILCMYQGE